MLLLALVFLLLLGHCSPVTYRAFGYRRLRQAGRGFFRQRSKSAWVGREIVRLKALMPLAGLRRYAHEVRFARRQIKNAKPRPLSRNSVWAIDLTGKVTLDGRTRLVLGILEHASRAALRLEAIESKSSWVLIDRPAATIRRYGKPQSIRTDNESVFVSRVFRLALRLPGVRHQRSGPHCPWQNGRIERFFGTLKAKLDRLAVGSHEVLNVALTEFRFFYNHLRPHQNLAGVTPAEAWASVDPYAARIREERWFEAWDGLLQGHYLRR